MYWVLSFSLLGSYFFFFDNTIELGLSDSFDKFSNVICFGFTVN
jgi:hypothetical protein